MLDRHDILFIDGTHCTQEMEINIGKYVAVQNPCIFNTPEKPMFIHKHLIQLVEGSDMLETLSIYDKETPNTIVCGDLNSRIGSFNQLNDYSYQRNPDVDVNQHGRRLLDICKCNH